MSTIVPIINIAPFIDPNSSKEEKIQVVQEIKRACSEIGFLLIIGHGIELDIINNAWKSTHDFFDLPLEDKILYQMPQHIYPFGYSPMGAEVLSTGKATEHGEHILHAPPDIKEMFSIGPSNPKAGFPPRIFPMKPLAFEKHWTEYYDAVNDLANQILQAFSLALELPDENFFKQFIDHHASALRAINYPAIESRDQILPAQCRASAHTDYGTITILRTDGPGLQVSKDLDPPVWHDVPHVENAFIVNLGDLMRRWTNDTWLSTLHRVIVPNNDITVINSDGEEERVVCNRRQSLAFFHNINPDAIVSPILRHSDEIPRHQPIVAGEFLLQKHLASIGTNTYK